ncbi:MAG: SusC/RagA family TonB-linked outer membrane protein, partial [Ferruginibacter sp.]
MMNSPTSFLTALLRNAGFKHFRKIVFLLIVGTVSISTAAYSVPLLAKKVSGQVTNQDGSPLASVTITLEGTTISTISDNAGSFTINIPDDQSNPTLIFSSTGYLTQQVTVDNKSSVDVKLIRDIKNLNEVVVVGYGTQKRKDLTGSIASVSSAQIEERPVSSYEDALAGVAAGIDVAPRSARPGNSAEITIRGIGTISGDRQPLFVVDGFPTDALNAAAINPSNIASVDILKDASSTAIYGSRGANGVIIITTKSGKTGQAKLDVDIKSGFSQANKHDFYHVLDGAQYVEWYKEAALNNGTAIPSWVTNWDGTSTNWQDIIYKPAPFQNYGLSVSGGTDKVTYFISANYLDQGDILLNGGYKKYSMRMKVDYKPSKRITMGINLAPNYTVQRQSAPEDDYSSLTGDAVMLPPIIPAYNKDGTPSDVNSYGVLAFNMVNPLTIAENYKWTQNNFYILGDAYLQVEIAKGLSARTSIGANISDNRYQLFQKQGMMGQALSPVTSLGLNSERTINWLNQNTLNYKATFNEVHKLELLAGYTVQKVTYGAVGATA